MLIKKILSGIFCCSFIFQFISVYGNGLINEGNYSDFLSCIKYDSEWYYAGDLHIPVSFDLKSEEEALDEATFAAILQSNLEQSEKEYRDLPESANGKILDTDIARNLYLPYASGIESRHNYICSTLMPAAWFVDYLYYNRLVELAILNKDRMGEKNATVVLLAGGDGSGKTSSVKQLGLEILEEADLIKDSTMSSDCEFHRNMIERTLALGLDVILVYVFRPIELALEGNIQRAQRIGRVRPLVEIAEAHYKAQQNVLQLSEYFGDRIKVLVIDNTSTFSEISLVDEGINFLKSSLVLYESKDAVLKRGLAAYHNMDKELIPEFVKNLLERKLNSSALQKESKVSETERERWVNYLKKMIFDIAKKLGL